MKLWFEDDLAAWGSGSVERVLDWITADVEFEDVGAGHKLSGRQGMAKFVARSFKLVPNVTFEFVGGAELDGERYCYEWVMQPVGVRGVSVGRRRNGQIAENRDYWSSATFTIPSH